MQPLAPLPLPSQPIAQGIGKIPDLAPVRTYAIYFSSADRALRALIASAPNTQPGSYVLKLTDQAGIVETNLAGANTLTVPPNSVVPFAIGTRITGSQIGAGQTTLTPGAGVTLRSRIGLKSSGQYAVFYLYKRGTDEWVASGDLTP